ncbi:MAG: AAA family ATPase, partial [Planctomycetaceae bacterium]|nr:AAA family ATPase [Planctomycetaceae bacterium]
MPRPIMSTGSLNQIDELLRSIGVTSDPSIPVMTETERPAAQASGPAPQAQSAVVQEAPPSSTVRPAAPRRPAPLERSPEPEAPVGRRVVQPFVPKAPTSVEDSGMVASEINDLILKFLLSRAVESGNQIAVQLGLKFGIIESLLRQAKVDRLVVYKNSLAGGDYLYELTDLGRDRARALAEQCTYFGTAPVPLDQYVASVKAQSLEGRKPPLADIRKAFSDLDLSDHLLSNIGQAIHSGRGMFLYGSPGNGKTSMAERVTKSFGDTIWIPRAIAAAGEIIRMFDPNRHKPIRFKENPAIDGRWVLIERPTIVAGGELQMDNLEINYIRKTGIGEAPLQLKANCGTLLIDDFGRQRMSTDELLNRWIVPLE